MDPYGGGYPDLVEKHEIPICFPDEGRHPTKNPETAIEDNNLLKRFQCKWVLLGVYGWMKRSLTFCGILGNPRNTKK